MHFLLHTLLHFPLHMSMSFLKWQALLHTQHPIPQLIIRPLLIPRQMSCPSSQIRFHLLPIQIRVILLHNPLWCQVSAQKFFHFFLPEYCSFIEKSYFSYCMCHRIVKLRFYLVLQKCKLTSTFFLNIVYLNNYSPYNPIISTLPSIFINQRNSCLVSSRFTL